VSQPRITERSASSEVGTRDRIITEAIRLFAERGFRGTTVGEIEAAVGLTPRSGGLYKLFPSKEAVLEAGLERHVRQIEAVRSALDFRPLGDLRAELTLLARLTLAELRAERPVLKIVQKDGDQFPRLVKLVRERIIKRGHETAIDLVGRLLRENGATVDHDSPALASVALAALVGRDLEEMMFKHEPGGIDEDHFIEAWVETWFALVHSAIVESGSRASIAR
jgi:AcrR family transcriptional regulator